MNIKIQKKIINIILGIFAVLFSASSVLAESSSSNTSPPLAGIGLILTLVMIYQINKSEEIAIKEADDKRVGVAGWLLFFIGLMTIGGIIVILRIISDVIQLIIYAPSLFLSFAFVFPELLDLVSGAASIVAAYYLWKIKPGARWLAIGVLVFDILVVGVNWLVYVDELYLVLSVLTLIYNTIEIIYFLTSERVKNTYIKNAKIPKTSASSNKNVIGWIVVQAITGLIFLAVFQLAGWAETAQLTEDMPCIEFCKQYPETDTYYFDYDRESGGLLCQCQTADNVIADKVFPSKSTS